MNEKLEETMAFLLEKGYVIRVDPHFYFTSQFYQDFTNTPIVVDQEKKFLLTFAEKVKERVLEKEFGKALDEIEIVSTSSGEVTKLPLRVKNMKELYMQFILDAKVPARVSASNGFSYDCNVYSKDGEKAFEKIMQRADINYDLLVKATTLYYKSPATKLKIGNFITQGVWETYYQSLSRSLENGTAVEHITESLKDGRSKYELG